MNKHAYMNQLLHKIFATFILLGLCTFTFAQTIQVLNIPDTFRTDYNVERGYHLSSNSTVSGTVNMISAKAKLTNTANFGPTGTVPHAFNIVDGFAALGSITSVAVLNTYDIIYIGYYYRIAGPPFDPAEVDILLEWSKQPGKVLMVQEQSSFSPISTGMGYSIINGGNTGATTLTPNDNTTGVNMFNGVFGNSSGIYQRGNAQGHFSGDCTGIPIGKNSDNRTTILFNAEYRDVIVADTDYFTEFVRNAGNLSFLSVGTAISNEADKAWANLWAWAVNEVINKPDPSAVTSTGEVYTNQTLPLCPGVSATVSLRNHNAPIVRWETSINGGAWTTIASTNTSITYTNPQNNQRFRAVLGNIAQGCPQLTSQPLNITTTTAVDAPTITTTAGTCSAAGTATVSNYSSTLSYTFSPAGPTVGAGGVISNATAGTSYTVTASNGICTSAASTAFTRTAQLTQAVAGTAGTNQTIAPGASPAALTLTGSSGTICWQNFYR